MEKRWLILVVLFLAQTATGFQYQSVGSASSLLVKDLSIDYARLGVLIGLYQLPGIVLAFPGSLLGKRLGDKRVVMMALGLMAGGGAIMGLSDTYSSDKCWTPAQWCRCDPAQCIHGENGRRLVQWAGNRYSHGDFGDQLALWHCPCSSFFRSSCCFLIVADGDVSDNSVECDCLRY